MEVQRTRVSERLRKNSPVTFPPLATKAPPGRIIQMTLYAIPILHLSILSHCRTTHLMTFPAHSNKTHTQFAMAC